MAERKATQTSYTECGCDARTGKVIFLPSFAIYRDQDESTAENDSTFITHAHFKQIPEVWKVAFASKNRTLPHK